MSAAIGTLLAGRYRLDRLIASGGMAQVWEATDEVLRRSVAVKLLHPHLAADDTFVTRFRREAVSAARLAHPNIVGIYDTCSDAGTEAIVMELVRGRTLRQRLDEPKPLDAWQAAAIAAQVADALDEAHRAGLVHRDVKPANILLCNDGRVKVADFGIAKAAEGADLTQEGLMIGTAKYLAPEQVTGDPVDARTDLYSLGLVLYEMLSGQPAFTGDTDAALALARIQRDPLRPRQVRPSVPRPLEDIVCKAIARDPAQRYRSAADLRAALLDAGANPADPVDQTGTTIAPATPLTPPGGSPRFTQSERGWLVPTLLVVLVAVALGTAGLLLGGSGAGDLIDKVRDAVGPGGEAALPIASVSTFDPRPGDLHENDKDAPLVLDGDTTTAWTTEGYNSRDVAALKGGVGLVLTLEQAAALDRIEVTSPTNAWRAQVYVADAPKPTLKEWGEPVFISDAIEPGKGSLDLKDRTGGAVLLWITDVGDGAPRVRATIAEVEVFGGGA